MEMDAAFVLTTFLIFYRGVRVFVWEDDQPKISMSIFDPKVGSE